MRTQIKELQDKLDKLEAERTPVANLAMGVLDAKGDQLPGAGCAAS